MSKLHLFIAALVAVFLLSGATRATQVTLHPIKDNTLYQSATGTTSNGAGEYFFVGKTGGGSVRRGLLAFDVAGNVPAGATVSSVTLTLHMSRTVALSQTVSLHRVLADWGEGTSNAGANEGAGAPATTGDATWLHRFHNTTFWTTQGGDFAATASASTTVGGIASYTWNSTPQLVADVQLWLDSPSQNFGWLVRGNESANSTAKRFDSREITSPTFQPTLTIDFSGASLPPVITLRGANPLVLPVGTPYVEPGFTATDDVDGNITANVVVTGSVNHMVLGSYALRYNVTDSDGNPAVERTRTVNVVDTTAPVITLLGENPMTFEVGTAYVEPGYTATDNYDGTITASVIVTGSVNHMILDAYALRYNVTDSSGNPALERTRTVNVVDTTAPVITLLGENPMTLEVGTAYVEPGYTATDNYDGDITANVVVTGSVNHMVLGAYVLHYNATDSSDNPAVEKTRTVNVVDTTAPVITLLGANPLVLVVGTPYVEPGYTATDNYDGDITASVVVGGSINADVPGTYTLTYNVSDLGGIPAEEKTRTVIVVEEPVVLDVVIASDGTLSLTWNDLGPNFVYTVESRTALLDGDWSPLPPTDRWPTGNTSWTGISTADGQMLFLRVKGEALP